MHSSRAKNDFQDDFLSFGLKLENVKTYVLKIKGCYASVEPYLTMPFMLHCSDARISMDVIGSFDFDF